MLLYSLCIKVYVLSSSPLSSPPAPLHQPPSIHPLSPPPPSPSPSPPSPASSLPLDGQNQCLKAAQDCGLFEKCGSLRSEYVLACTKRAPGSDHCNRQKCHRALRRFLERVPEAYSFGVLFCPCADALCGERRRKTIVPSCSYQERDGKPNCLSLQGYCMKDELCRSEGKTLTRAQTEGGPLIRSHT